jgi:hypothetical protein
VPDLGLVYQIVKGNVTYFSVLIAPLKRISSNSALISIDATLIRSFCFVMGGDYGLFSLFSGGVGGEVVERP